MPEENKNNEKAQPVEKTEKNAKPKKILRKKNKRHSYLSKDFFIDCMKDDMLYAALVRSPEAGGKITNINFSDLPEGYYFFSARDIPGKNFISTMGIETRIFCNEKVHYKGQPVGIVAGPDLSEVRKIAQEIQITFDITTMDSPEIKEVAQQLNHSEIIKNLNLPQNPKIQDDPEQNDTEEKDSAPDDSAIADIVDMLNVAPSLDAMPKPTKKSSYTQPSQIEDAFENINPGKHTQRILAERTATAGFFSYTDDQQILDDEFKLCPFDISSTWSMDEVCPEWIEPNGVFCYKEGQKLNVMTTTQWPSYLSKNLSQVLNIDEDKIVVQKTISQTDNTSGIWRNTTLAAQTALATLLTGKPVKLLLSKQEQKTFFHPGLDTNIKIRSAVEADGTIKAMVIDIDCDAGYSNPFAQEIADRMAVAASSFYNPKNVIIKVKVHSSDNPPTSVYSQLMDSQAFFAMENHLQLIAEKTNILPEELRIKNICMNEHECSSPFKFHFNRPADALMAIVKQSDFDRKYSSYRLNAIQSKKEGGHTFFALPRRGIGLSCAYDGACFYGTNFSLAQQKIEVTLDEENKLRIDAITPSSSVISIWKQIASSILNIEESQISINTEYAADSETFMPESFCNDISIMAVLLKRACEDIKKKLEKEKLPINVKKMLSPAMKRQWNSKKFSGHPYQASSFGTAIVEVDLNADTYQEKIKGIWVAIDCGKIYSIKSAESTIKLAIQQELERLVQDTIVSCDQIKISFLSSNETPCQIGKLVHNLIPAAFSSALSMARQKAVTHIPCTEQELYELTKAPETSEKDEEDKEPKENYKIPEQKTDGETPAETESETETDENTPAESESDEMPEIKEQEGEK